MKLSNLKIGTRLGGAFAVILLLLIGVALLGINRMGLMDGRMKEITSVNNVQSQLALAMSATVSERMIALRNIVLLDSEEQMAPEIAGVELQTRAYADAEQGLRHLLGSAASTEEETGALERATAAAANAAPIMAKVIGLGRANANSEATSVLLRELKPVQQQWMAALGDLARIEEKQNAEAVADAELAYRHAWTAMVALTLFAVGFGALLAWTITRGITLPIQSAVRIAKTVAAGNLTSIVHVSSQDETGELLRALQDMNGSLVQIVSAVRLSTDTISTASSEIAAGNLDLSSRTEEQAGSLEETASAMEQLTSAVQQNAASASQANALAGSASQVALKGGLVVSQVVDTMASISDSSKKIADIIGVIDAIAFQTNILALNAAVEAARAGEQGRGFAVVATEVRTLAQRSAAAAREIKLLIDDSVGKVDSGSALVGQAGATMREVVDSVQRVTDIMGEIAQASQEQRSGIEQINQAIASMDTVTQQNAALVEQAAAAAASLQQQAAMLSEEVSVFVVAPATALLRDHRPVPAQARIASAAKPLRLLTCGAL